MSFYLDTIEKINKFLSKYTISACYDGGLIFYEDGMVMETHPEEWNEISTLPIGDLARKDFFILETVYYKPTVAHTFRPYIIVNCSKKPMCVWDLFVEIYRLMGELKFDCITINKDKFVGAKTLGVYHNV